MHTKYLIIGLGKTGHAIARYLTREHQPFVVYDTRQVPEAAAEFQQEFPGVALFLEHFPEEQWPEITEVIASPGVPLDSPCLLQAKALGIPVYGDIECLARAIDTKIIAITGTNGKSTVTTLVGLMAQAAGLKTAVAGNIGTPVLDLLHDENQYELWVLELSSFQLDLTDSLRPHAATILNISPDHLDRHHSLEAYIAAKQRIYRHAKVMLYNRDDALTQPALEIDSRLRGNDTVVTDFGLNAPQAKTWGIVQNANGTFLAYGATLFCDVQDLRIKGSHNWANALAACALAHSLGIAFSTMHAVLKSFSGLPHRSQWVRTLDQVDWINDSKGTNIGATQSAISGIGNAIQGKIVLIAGGQGKGADFRFLRDTVAAHVRSMVLLGEDADKLEAALADIVPTQRVSTLAEAVERARTMATSGDVVLLSPACASLDMFHDFNHRGEVFAELVGKL